MKATLAALLTILATAEAGCPFASGGSTERILPTQDRRLTTAGGTNYTFDVDYEALKADIGSFFLDSQESWPADFGNYAPFMIRLAWHCSGSYRSSDGRGGCDGARIRQSPEKDWPDNANLDKALMLLEPLKAKYGEKLSWADLIVLTGTVAIESMGGPVLGFCAGRMDDADGSASLTLGPTPEQEALAPCAVNGECEYPLGPTTVGLIYVNPEGHLASGDPASSVADLRSSFGRMGMGDRETVALTGAHAFGKFHGACPEPPCGEGPLKGKGPNTYTSGLEGSWTTKPTEWSNEYYQNLLEYDFSVVRGPGGKQQMQPSLKAGDPGPANDFDMLVSDVGYTKDPAYLSIVQEFASDIGKLEEEFAAAWYKLVSRDMGPVSRCIGPDVPPAQPFQYPLPDAPKKLADFDLVARSIRALIHQRDSPVTAAWLITLAYNSASTFRITDYFGGANGARIRLEPASCWPSNVGLSEVIWALEPIRTRFNGPSGALSMADLIVLAGNVALEEVGSNKLDFCGGRVDALNPWGPELAPRTYYSDAIIAFRDNAQVMGLSPREAVALAARPRSPEQEAQMGAPSGCGVSTTLSSSYYATLLSETWVPVGEDSKALGVYYKADGKDVYASSSDLALIWDDEFKAIAEEYAAHEATFKDEFAAAWTKLMIADRFDGPTGNKCAQK